MIWNPNLRCEEKIVYYGSVWNLNSIAWYSLIQPANKPYCYKIYLNFSRPTGTLLFINLIIYSVFQTFSKKSKISKPNGYLGVDHLSDVFPLVDSSEINKENVFSTNFQKSDRFGDAFSRDNEDFLSDHSSTKDGLLKETKNFCPFTLKSQIEGLENEAISYAQGYSLFASGTNLLQNAGIHIPPVTSANSSPVSNSLLICDGIVNFGKYWSTKLSNSILG